MAPPMRAVAGYRQSRRDAGGMAPIRTSRIMPPTSAVANASTITPSRSRLAAPAARPPSTANRSVPAKSTESNSLESVFIKAAESIRPGARQTQAGSKQFRREDGRGVAQALFSPLDLGAV